jgi:hypothetical protein
MIGILNKQDMHPFMPGRQSINFFTENFFIYKNILYTCIMKTTTVQSFIPQLIYQRG